MLYYIIIISALLFLWLFSVVFLLLVWSPEGKGVDGDSSVSFEKIHDAEFVEVFPLEKIQDDTPHGAVDGRCGAWSCSLKILRDHKTRHMSGVM